jgi:hypothetical protein
MMHKDQTHINRNCFSIGIISSKLQSGCYKIALILKVAKRGVNRQNLKIVTLNLDLIPLLVVRTKCAIIGV